MKTHLKRRENMKRMLMVALALLVCASLAIPTYAVENEFGSGRVLQSAYILTTTLFPAWKKYFQEQHSYIEEAFDFNNFILHLYVGC